MTDEEASPFIERRFELLDEEVVLHFNRPFLAPTRDYRCDWRVRWPDRDESSYAHGIDAIQALLLAMRSAHSRLKIERRISLRPTDVPRRPRPGPSIGSRLRAGGTRRFTTHCDAIRTDYEYRS